MKDFREEKDRCLKCLRDVYYKSLSIRTFFRLAEHVDLLVALMSMPTICLESVWTDIILTPLAPANPFKD